MGRTLNHGGSIVGAHLLLYSDDADADRAFLRDTLGFTGVDAGGGWLIFTLPPAEVAVHPTGGGSPRSRGGRAPARAELYLMCQDVGALVSRLAAQGVECAAISRERWGLRTSIPLPSGAALGLYEPAHDTALRGRAPSGVSDRPRSSARKRSAGRSRT